jgi:type VI protein secretion system component VasF
MLLRAKDHRALRSHPAARDRPRQSTAPRLAAWLFAVGVVAVLAIGLHALYH